MYVLWWVFFLDTEFQHLFVKIKTTKAQIKKQINFHNHIFCKQFFFLSVKISSNDFSLNKQIVDQQFSQQVILIDWLVLNAT